MLNKMGCRPAAEPHRGQPIVSKQKPLGEFYASHSLSSVSQAAIIARRTLSLASVRSM